MIETERLLLRPMRADDIDDLLHIFSDPKVMASFGGILFERPQMERWVQRNLDHQAQYGYGLFSVIHKVDGCLIGDCGLEQMELGEASETELGYDFRSDYWNQGLATEAAAAVRDYAFQVLQLPRLVSLIRPGNKASQRVAEKIGMQLTAEIRRNEQPYYVYRITALAPASGGIE
jgi:ribosomal-protein-alanine N-acetyltransferase